MFDSVGNLSCCWATGELGWIAYVGRVMDAQALENSNWAGCRLNKKAMEVNLPLLKPPP